MTFEIVFLFILMGWPCSCSHTKCLRHKLKILATPTDENLEPPNHINLMTPCDVFGVFTHRDALSDKILN